MFDTQLDRTSGTQLDKARHDGRQVAQHDGSTGPTKSQFDRILSERLNKSLNKTVRPADTPNVTVHRATPQNESRPPTEVGAGTILVNRAGQVRIVRSRTADGSGWNCADGAAIDDDEARDQDRWTAYTPLQLAAALTLAEEVRQISGQRELAGGIATWDACSGRPCVLPRLARVVNRPDHDPVADWLAALD